MLAPASSGIRFSSLSAGNALPKLLRHLEGELSGALSDFEVMWPEFYELVTTEPAKGRPVLPQGHLRPWFHGLTADNATWCS